MMIAARFSGSGSGKDVLSRAISLIAFGLLPFSSSPIPVAPDPPGPQNPGMWHLYFAEGRWIEGMTNYNDAGRQFWLEALWRPALSRRAAEVTRADHCSAAWGGGVRGHSAGQDRGADEGPQ
jgi:hypothetical protein